MADCAYISLCSQKNLRYVGDGKIANYRDKSALDVEHANIEHLYANNLRYLVVRVLLHYYPAVSYHVRVVSREI